MTMVPFSLRLAEQDKTDVVFLNMAASLLRQGRRMPRSSKISAMYLLIEDCSLYCGTVFYKTVVLVLTLDLDKTLLFTQYPIDSSEQTVRKVAVSLFKN